MPSKWRVLPVPDIGTDYDGHLRNTRLNSLGSLFWFAKNVLGYTRLAPLHKLLCASLEKEHLFLVMEVPMSHFKTRLGIALSIWWALPFNDRDEEHMRKLGYKDEWISYMTAMHDQNMRTLVCHEIAEQATAIGRDVDATYENNDLFKHTFPEIIPDRNCVWNNAHKFQKRLPGGDSTTGTFEYRGVGQALQGIHLKGIISDDIFGREAQVSVLRGDGRVAQDTIGWFQQVGTRFDPIVKKARRQLVIGNPWCHGDINAWIKKNLPEFSFESHDAEGGCCKHHPAGKPILPTEWTMELLQGEKLRLDASGNKGDYEHFYRCMHTLPGEQIFKKEYLRMFKFKQARPDLPVTDLRNILLLEHEVYDKKPLEDFQPGLLTMRMLVNPNHAKKKNRTDHVIWVVGYDSESSRIYLLDLWCESCSHSELVDTVYKKAERWFLSEFWMGEVAAEILRFYLEQRDRRELKAKRRTLDINEYPDDDSQAGMKNRIEALEPLFREHKVWTHPSHKKFLDQYENYPANALDTLDGLSHLSTTLDLGSDKDAKEFLIAQQDAFANRNSGEGGY